VEFEEIKTELKSTFIDLFTGNFFELRTKESLFDILTKERDENMK
jgi:hypothetical protein